MIALAVAGLVTTGAIAYAADSTSDQSQSPKETMMQGAIDKGIISQDQANQLQSYQKDSMKQKHQEMMQNRIDKAIEDGTITQDEASQIKSWQDSRPAALDKIDRPGGKGMGMKKME